MQESIAIAGTGKMGQALGRLLLERGEPVVAIAGRDRDRARRAAAFVGGATAHVAFDEIPRMASRVLVAVADGAIAPVAEMLAAGMRGGVALHTSGAHGPEILSALSKVGVACGALHPLQTVAGQEAGVRVLPGSAFAIDGAGGALQWAEHLVRVLNGLALRIPAAARPIYHAAAVLSSNYLIAMVASAVMLMKEAGVEEATARRALEPLARASIDNAFEMGPMAALTGPIARGDIETVRGHLAGLAQLPGTITQMYCTVGLAALATARQQGLKEARADAIEELLRKEEQK